MATPDEVLARIRGQRAPGGGSTPDEVLARIRGGRTSSVTQARFDPEGMGNLPSGEPADATERTLGRQMLPGRPLEQRITGQWANIEEGTEQLARGITDIPHYALNFAGDFFQSLLPTEAGREAGGRVLGTIGDVAGAIDPGVQLPGVGLGRARPQQFAQRPTLGGGLEPTTGPLGARPQLGAPAAPPGTGFAAGLDVRPQLRPPMGGAPQAPSGPLPPARQLPAPGATPAAATPSPGTAGRLTLPQAPRGAFGPGEATITPSAPARGGQPGDVFRGRQEIRRAEPIRPLVKPDAHEGEPSRLASALVNDDAATSQRLISRYRQTIRPSLGKGRRTEAGISAQDRAIQSSVDAIISNRDNITLYNDRGVELQPGSLPSTLRQWVHAIDQTKTQLFEEYDGVAQRMGQQGVRIPLQPAVDKMLSIAQEPEMRLANPNLLSEAKVTADQWRQMGSLSPKQMQNLLQHLYADLDVFTAAPKKGGSSEKQMMTQVIGVLRDNLHGTMEQALQGPQYAALRQRYGSLAAVEDDIGRAFKNKAAALPGGIAEALAGPAAIATGLRGAAHLLAGHGAGGLLSAATIKGGELLNRYLRNPNRSVRAMFEQRARDLNPSFTQRASARAAVELGELRQRRYDALRRGDNVEYRSTLNQ